LNSGYDIIGDIHGHHDKLVKLLQKLGYREHDGAWRMSGRVAIFVGDLIDRGPAQIATVSLVRRMVDAGSARCIIGNHEFNAIAWSMPDPQNPGEYLRPHGKPSNRKHHAAFLAEVEGRPVHQETIDWLRTLPLWIEEPGIRVVHACWHSPSIDWLRSRLTDDHCLLPEMYEAGSRKGSRAYMAIEAVCKGLEVEFPQGHSFHDKDGNERHAARIRWWDREIRTFRQAAIGPAEVIQDVPDVPIPDELRPEPYVGPPVFFGHYWLTGEPGILAENAACLDYSVGNGGPIVAYRWDGEEKLRSENFRSAG
jgi:diadenosine tetraphosphatase ApaH/serine/threonine PP2A family protein phosphatase